MFEAYTYEFLLNDVLENAPVGIDTRQGSIFYDAVSGPLLKIAKLYTDLESVFELVFIGSATGEFLDKRADENGVTRLPATRCCYYVTFEGAMPAVGERFFTNGLYFSLQKDEKGVYYLMAEEKGTINNNIYPDTPAVPLNNIKGLTSATFGEIMQYGVDAESDDDLRNRIREKIAGPAENGNRQHYKTWCEEVEGVGRARIIPLWDGPSTVKGIILNALGMPAEQAIVQSVQEYIDPGRTGLGDGVANIGAHFTAVSATACIVNVSYNAVLANGASDIDVKTQFTEAIQKHLKEINLETPEGEPAILRLSTVGAIIYGLPSILDYSDLKFNNESSNIEAEELEALVLGEVTINAT